MVSYNLDWRTPHWDYTSTDENWTTDNTRVSHILLRPTCHENPDAQTDIYPSFASIDQPYCWFASNSENRRLEGSPPFSDRASTAWFLRGSLSGWSPILEVVVLVPDPQNGVQKHWIRQIDGKRVRQAFMVACQPSVFTVSGE